MSNLKTNYKDDVFVGNRKYTLVNNGDGTVSFVDATEYTQEGDILGASDINGINTQINQNTNDIAGKAPSSHTHDDRYYTETEVNNLLNGKANSTHTHTASQVSGLPTSLPANGGNADTVDGYHIAVVTSLPSSQAPNTIYFVRS